MGYLLGENSVLDEPRQRGKAAGDLLLLLMHAATIQEECERGKVAPGSAGVAKGVEPPLCSAVRRKLRYIDVISDLIEQLINFKPMTYLFVDGQRHSKAIVHGGGVLNPSPINLLIEDNHLIGGMIQYYLKDQILIFFRRVREILRFYISSCLDLLFRYHSGTS